MNTMKQCSKCKLMKKSEHFYNLKTGKLSCWCKECNREVTAKWKKSRAGKASDKKYKQSDKGKVSRKRYMQSEKGKAAKRKDRINNKEAYKKRQKRWHAKPENKEKHLASGRRWSNSPKGQIYKKQYIQKPEVKARMKVHRRKHEKGKGYQKKLLKNRIHFARRRAAGDLTATEWKLILVKYNHRCAYCGKKAEKLTIDHIIPVAKGGKTIASNIAPACQKCNSTKRDKLIKPKIKFEKLGTFTYFEKLGEIRDVYLFR